MTSTRKKMYKTNGKIRKFLYSSGFKNLYLFPHLRFMKDYIFESLPFDAIGWKDDRLDKRVYLFQFKTNKKASKKILRLYGEVEKKYYCRCLWVNKVKRGKIEVYESSKI